MQSPVSGPDEMLGLNHLDDWDGFFGLGPQRSLMLPVIPIAAVGDWNSDWPHDCDLCVMLHLALSLVKAVLLVGREVFAIGASSGGSIPVAMLRILAATSLSSQWIVVAAA
jgi:hypothetical protein